MKPVVRVSILRCPPERFAELRLKATSSLTNVSLWTSLEAAKQLDTFQPMLDLAKPFSAKGATFEHPIMNYATLWQLKGTAMSGEAMP
jgi:hypothetical protein